MPSWLSFATHLADRRGLFSKGPLSQVQDFLIKVDMALTKPMAEGKKDLAMLRRDIGIAHVIKGADPRKIFPSLTLAYQQRAARVQGEEIIDREGPIEVISTMSTAEAQRDIEALMRAEARGSLTAEDLFGLPDNENNHDDDIPS